MARSAPFIYTNNLPEAIFIREAVAAEANLLADLGSQTFYETFREVIPPAEMQTYLKDSFSAEVIMGEIKNGGATYYILEIANIPVAYAKLRKTRNEQYGFGNQDIELERLYILKNM